MIKVTGAGFSYGNKSLLFSDISFEVREGETLAILGPNGIGKTTLLRCMMRFLPLKKGKIEIQGESVEGMSQKQFWKDISYVPQAKRLVFGYSAVNMVVMESASVAPNIPLIIFFLFIVFSSLKRNLLFPLTYIFILELLCKNCRHPFAKSVQKKSKDAGLSALCSLFTLLLFLISVQECLRTLAARWEPSRI